MSTSKDLQKCLDNLESYCTKWKLEINMEKTKVVLFNRQRSLIKKKHKFTYKLNHTDIAQEYKYLGFIFACSGSTNAGITNLIKQAKTSLIFHSILPFCLKKQKYRHIPQIIRLKS